MQTSGSSGTVGRTMLGWGWGGGVHCFPTLDYGKKDAWPKKMSGEQSAIVDCVPRSIMNPIILSSAPSFIFQWIDSSPVLEG